jgi:hypothetical protein
MDARTLHEDVARLEEVLRNGTPAATAPGDLAQLGALLATVIRRRLELGLYEFRTLPGEAPAPSLNCPPRTPE